MSVIPHSQEDAFGTPPEERKSRFYFDVREGSRFLPDDEGLEFPDLGAAEREAAIAAAEIGRDWLPRGDAREIVIEVRNEHGRRVLTVTVSMHVERVHPSPVASGGSTLSETSQTGIVAAAILLT